MLKVTMNGIEYEYATTLRVAYSVQGRFNHKPYTKVFEGIGDMMLEEQLRILYTAFKLQNPAVSMTEQEFVGYYLDHFNVKVVMSQLKTLIQEVMGTTDEEIEAAQAEAIPAGEVPEGN